MSNRVLRVRARGRAESFLVSATICLPSGGGGLGATPHRPVLACSRTSPAANPLVSVPGPVKTAASLAENKSSLSAVWTTMRAYVLQVSRRANLSQAPLTEGQPRRGRVPSGRQLVQMVVSFRRLPCEY